MYLCNYWTEPVHTYFNEDVRILSRFQIKMYEAQRSLRRGTSISGEQLTSTTIKMGLLEVTRVIAIYHHVIVILLSRVQIQQNCVHGDEGDPWLHQNDLCLLA